MGTFSNIFKKLANKIRFRSCFHLLLFQFVVLSSTASETVVNICQEGYAFVINFQRPLCCTLSYFNFSDFEHVYYIDLKHALLCLFFLYMGP